MRWVRFSTEQAFADFPLRGKRLQHVHADLLTKQQLPQIAQLQLIKEDHRTAAGRALRQLLFNISSRRLPSPTKVTDQQVEELAQLIGQSYQVVVELSISSRRLPSPKKAIQYQFPQISQLSEGH